MFETLDAVELIPVLELVPTTFSQGGRKFDDYDDRGLPDPCGDYWRDSLADSGIVGLTPIPLGSWFIPVAEFQSPVMIARYLAVIIGEWGGAESFAEPDWEPVLNGGLVLRAGGEILITPQCCVSLADVKPWRDAAESRDEAWKMLWIGHPWISSRFDADSVILSDLHEGKSPKARYAVHPAELARAVAAAESELDAFAARMHPALAELGVTDVKDIARKLVGRGAAPVC